MTPGDDTGGGGDGGIGGGAYTSAKTSLLDGHPTPPDASHTKPANATTPLTSDDQDQDLDTTSKAALAATTSTPSSSTSKPSIFRRRPVLGSLLLLILLGLILGLALGLTVGRSNHHPRGNSGSGGGDGAGGKWKRPEKLAASEEWVPSPFGGSDKAWKDAYDKARVLVGKMSLLEKVNVTTGIGWSMGPCVGNTGETGVGVGFPSLCLQDGPLGIRYTNPVTAFPAALTTAATFSKDLILRRAEALGIEARTLGVNALLGPCIGPIGRSPLGGRNWESFGSDPYLQGISGALTVRGIQSKGVMAVAKHFLLNEQERFRRGDEARGEERYKDVKESVSSNAGERAVRELHLWPWMDVVREGVAGVMCAYNMVNNTYACGNSWLLNGVLKDELGFQGFVVSDWLAQRTGVESVLAGMDMTMPGDGLVWSDGRSLLGSELTKAVVNGSVPISRLDDMVLRIVASWYQLGQDSPTFPKKPTFSSWFRDRIGPQYFGTSNDNTMVLSNNFTDPRGEHSKLAREIAAEGIVMLKNTNLTLPLSGGGGGQFRKEPFREIAVFGTDAGHSNFGPNGCADRGCNMGTLAQGWGSGSVEFPYLISPLEAIQARALEDGSTVSFVLEDGATQRVNATADAAGKRGVDGSVCLVFVSSDSGEGYIHSEGHDGDRKDLGLWHSGDEMILAVAERCLNTVVVVHTVGPIIMEKWVDHPNVKAILIAHLPGQESGTSLVDVLYGALSPSGHLPYTIGRSLSDYGPHALISTVPNWEIPQVDFDEGVYIDYRWFDKKNITPRYEFGYGKTYSGFKFSELRIVELVSNAEISEFLPGPKEKLTPPTVIGNSSVETINPKDLEFPKDWKKIDRFVYPYLPATATSTGTTSPRQTGTSSTAPVHPPQRNLTSTPNSSGGYQGGLPSLYDPLLSITVLLTNIGPVKAKMAAQLYISYPNTTIPDVPVRQLRGFEKVELESGESRVVEFVVLRRDLMVWEGGRYGVYVGPSSRGFERGDGVSGWTGWVGKEGS
ncbi:family 3 glycoside hydrolase [Peziza echinospora]|nr:family 3 glycoside hydrolase [Peziza echinospora]